MGDRKDFVKSITVVSSGSPGQNLYSFYFFPVIGEVLCLCIQDVQEFPLSGYRVRKIISSSGGGTETSVKKELMVKSTLRLWCLLLCVYKYMT